MLKINQLWSTSVIIAFIRSFFKFHDEKDPQYLVMHAYVR